MEVYTVGAVGTSASAYDLAIANRLHCHFTVATHTSPMKVLPEHMLRLVAPEDGPITTIVRFAKTLYEMKKLTAFLN